MPKRKAKIVKMGEKTAVFNEHGITLTTTSTAPSTTPNPVTIGWDALIIALDALKREGDEMVASFDAGWVAANALALRYTAPDYEIYDPRNTRPDLPPDWEKADYSELRLKHPKAVESVENMIRGRKRSSLKDTPFNVFVWSVVYTANGYRVSARLHSGKKMMLETSDLYKD